MEFYSLLADRKPRSILPAALHPLPPFLPKVEWTKLGDYISGLERDESVDGKRWISLRLDGSGFSSLTKKLRTLNVLEPGYSTTFAEIMRTCCQDLAKYLQATVAFTQSDEITILIAPTRSIPSAKDAAEEDEPVHHPHTRNGRILKLCTLAASYATATFNKALALHTPRVTNLAFFDCRLAQYATREEALLILLWRSYDCGINGVSDAVYRCTDWKGTTRKEIMNRSTGDKLLWLQEQNKLPLPLHQAQGSCWVRVKKEHVGRDPRTEKETITLRSKLQEVQGNLITLIQNKALISDKNL